MLFLKIAPPVSPTETVLPDPMHPTEPGFETLSSDNNSEKNWCGPYVSDDIGPYTQRTRPETLKAHTPGIRTARSPVWYSQHKLLTLGDTMTVPHSQQAVISLTGLVQTIGCGSPIEPLPTPLKNEGF